MRLGFREMDAHSFSFTSESVTEGHADKVAHQLARRRSEERKADVLPYLRPDGKAQVSIGYDVVEHGHRRPVEIERVLVSAQHREGLDPESLLKPDLIEHVIHPILPRDMY